jgi:DNA-binding NarL/FixJ family response regulator
VRASDHRITPWSAPIAPEWAVEVPNVVSMDFRQPHEVTLTKPLLRRLCGAVRVAAPHETQQDVARMLGVHPQTLYTARRAGRMTVEYYKGLMGRRGRPVPVLFTRDLLDPNHARHWRRPHALWGTHWQNLTDFVPDEFEQPVERVPFHVGTRAAVRAGAHDKELFRGWRWLCPGCRKPARTIYYPIAPVNFPELLAIDPAPAHRGDADARPDMPPCFACTRCHGVRHFSPVARGSWNYLICYLSAGLLYGREVPKPAWYVPERLRPYHPLPRRAASQRQQQVLDRLKQGWPMTRIALELRIGTSAVEAYARQVYRHHHVRTRRELMRVLNVSTPQPIRPRTRPRVLALLLKGLSIKQIARELGIKTTTVETHATRVYREQRVSGKTELVMRARHRARYSRLSRQDAETRGASTAAKWEQVNDAPLLT